MDGIRKLRERANLTQGQLAATLQVDKTTISKWETGGATPRADKLPEIARALKCSIDDLFGFQTHEKTKYTA